MGTRRPLSHTRAGRRGISAGYFLGDRLLGGSSDRAEGRLGLQQHLLELLLRIGLNRDGAAYTNPERAGRADDRPDHDAEVRRAVQPEEAERAGVDAPGLLLELVEDL